MLPDNHQYAKVMRHGVIDINLRSCCIIPNIMRTTLSLDDDVFRLVKRYADRRSLGLGKVSELVRRAFRCLVPHAGTTTEKGNARMLLSIMYAMCWEKIIRYSAL